MHTLAASQHGVVTRAQLVELGLSPAAVGRRLKSGRLRPLHRGVYLVGPLKPDRAAEMAAVLLGGPAALVSHTSALTVWRLWSARNAGPVHVTVPGSGRSGRRGIRFHRVDQLADEERAIIDGIPVTSPSRTLADVAGVFGSRELELVVSAAEREGLISDDELAALPDRYRGRPGIPMLTELVEPTGRNFTRSEAERRCLEMLRRGGLPRPHANVPFGPYELDFFWPDERVAIEVDGRAHHTVPPRFEGDRRKDAWLRARGIEVIRLTWRQITGNATATAVQVGQTLAIAAERQAALRRGSAQRAGDHRPDGG